MADRNDWDRYEQQQQENYVGNETQTPLSLRERLYSYGYGIFLIACGRWAIYLYDSAENVGSRRAMKLGALGFAVILAGIGLLIWPLSHDQLHSFLKRRSKYSLAVLDEMPMFWRIWLVLIWGASLIALLALMETRR